MSDITISLTALESLITHQNFHPSKTQEDYYRENGSPESILQYARVSGWGAPSESICRDYFNMDPRGNSGHDHCKLGKKIEQKSSRHGGNGAEWKWQHIEMSHEWDYLLICGLDFQGLQFYITTRQNIEDLIRDRVIGGQGGKGSDGIAQPRQGYWFTKSDFRKKQKNFTDYFTQLTDEQSLIDYINQSA